MIKKGSFNLKILFFGFGMIIFFASTMIVYSIISNNKATINEESKQSTDCLYLDFRIDKATYTDGKILLIINSPSTNTENIEKITIDSNGKSYSKEASIIPGASLPLTFDGVTANEYMVAYANECEGFEKRIMI